jgi:hypothetical protein
VIKRDYLLRMINECTAALARLAKRRDEDDDALLDEIRTQGRALLGIEPDALLLLPDEQCLALLQQDREVDYVRVALLGRLLLEEARILSRRAQGAAASARYIKGTGLLARAAREAQGSMHDAVVAHVDEVNALLREARERDGYVSLPLTAVVTYYEATLQLGRAEDELYFARQEHEPEAANLAREFYQRLLARSDEELERGNLPRDEVEAALRDLA